MTHAVAEQCAVPAAKLDIAYHPGMDVVRPGGFATGTQVLYSVLLNSCLFVVIIS